MIQRDQQIAGSPATAARQLMRKIGDSGVTASFVDDFLGDGREGRRILEDLEVLGFVCRVDPSSHPMVRFGSGDNLEIAIDLVGVWGTTVAGNALAKARLGKPISRSRAQVLLDGLLARVAAVNNDPQVSLLSRRSGCSGVSRPAKRTWSAMWMCAWSSPVALAATGSSSCPMWRLGKPS